MKMAMRQKQLLLLVCGLCYLAQSFVAWGWPALDGYPAIERWLDPNFLRADFYTNTTDGYGVDTWQAVLFGSIQRVTGLHYALQIAILTALRHVLWPFVLYRFFRILLRDDNTAMLAVVLGVLSDFALPKTLGWAWVWGDGSPALFANFLVVLAWTDLLARRAWSCFLLLAIATICQPLVGVHGGLFIAAIFFLDYSGEEKARALRSPANYAGGLVFAITFASQYLSLSPPAGERLPIADYVRILAWERHPGDFLPSRFPVATWISFALAAAAMALMAAREWKTMPRRTLILGGLALYAAICIAGYLFVEIWPVRFFVDLIPYRTVTIGAPLMLAIIAVFCGSGVNRQRWFLVLSLFAAFFLAGPYGNALHITPILPAALLLVTAMTAFATNTGDVLPGRDGYKPILGIAIPAFLLLALPLAYVRLSEMKLPTIENQHPVYRWARTATPREARFLVEQVSSDSHYAKAISPQRMRLIGRRAVVASRDFPFRDSAGRDWLRTWIIGLDHGRADRVETASADELKAICTALPYDYVIRARPLPAGSIREIARFGSANGVPELHVYSPCGGLR